MNGSKSVAVSAPNVSQVDLSCTHTTTSDWLRLFPIYIEEMCPSDTFHADVNISAKLAQMATKMNGSAHIDVHAFFVPNRLLHDGWNAFILGETMSNLTTNNLPYVTPAKINAAFADYESHGDSGRVTSHAFASFLSNFGIPCEMYKDGVGNKCWRVVPSIPTDYKFSVLPFRAYQKIFWDWYRDSQQIPESNKNSYLDTSNGLVSSFGSQYSLRYRCFMKDYITTALRSPQVGSGGIVSNSYVFSGTGGNSAAVTARTSAGSQTGNPSNISYFSIGADASAQNSVSSVASVASLRFANAMQRFCERLNVVGTRPMERLLALFGVQPTAERLDMAEYLGNKVVPLNFEALTNDAATNVLDSANYNNPFGIDITGQAKDMGTSVGTGGGQGQSETFSFRATEHGIFMVIASIVPDYTYKNRIPRSLIRGLMTADTDRTAFLLPDFEGTGYQHLMLSEVVVPTSLDNPSSSWLTNYKTGQVVGYQPRYEEYRSHMSMVAGDYVVGEGADSLQATLFTRDYVGEFGSPTQITAATPNLHQGNQGNTSFLDNVFQITSDLFDHFMIDVSIVNNAQRPLTMNSLPTELADNLHGGKVDNALGGVRLGS